MNKEARSSDIKRNGTCANLRWLCRLHLEPSKDFIGPGPIWLCHGSRI